MTQLEPLQVPPASPHPTRTNTCSNQSATTTTTTATTAAAAAGPPSDMDDGVSLDSINQLNYNTVSRCSASSSRSRRMNLIAVPCSPSKLGQIAIVGSTRSNHPSPIPTTGGHMAPSPGRSQPPMDSRQLNDSQINDAASDGSSKVCFGLLFWRHHVVFKKKCELCECFRVLLGCSSPMCVVCATVSAFMWSSECGGDSVLTK